MRVGQNIYPCLDVILSIQLTYIYPWSVVDVDVSVDDPTVDNNEGYNGESPLRLPSRKRTSTDDFEQHCIEQCKKKRIDTREEENQSKESCKNKI